ncbi:MAG: hypothetical protein GX780_04465 [Campylobacteraceae bacterium]|nr:hypothetical protein [Campylobacteraceae bacterium]
MENHKVVNIKITYEPGKMDASERKDLEDKIANFIEGVKGRKGTRVLAKRHDVAVNIMLDEYGIEID